MNRVDRLLRRYERFVMIPWPTDLAGVQKVWFVVYDKTDELRLRTRIDEFELATRKAGHGWKLCDLTGCFARWMADQEYREGYFESPEDLDMLLPDFVEQVVDEVSSVLKAPDAGPDTVVALMGIACLFGFARVSDIVQRVAPPIRGRLLVFFPGEYEDNNYRLLDARDGWNYMAVPITAEEETQS